MVTRGMGYDPLCECERCRSSRFRTQVGKRNMFDIWCTPLVDRGNRVTWTASSAPPGYGTLRPWREQVAIS